VHFDGYSPIPLIVVMAIFTGGAAIIYIFQIILAVINRQKEKKRISEMSKQKNGHGGHGDGGVDRINSVTRI